MGKYATVTLSDGSSVKPVLVYPDARGIRFYRSEKGKIFLLASVPGLVIESFGEERRLERGGPRVKLPVAFRGADLPSFIVTVEKARCGCGSPLPNFRPPREWETNVDDD